jgi:hypothetical protein
MNSLVLLLLSSTTLICKSTLTSATPHQQFQSKNTPIINMRAKQVGLRKVRYEDESSHDQIELKSLVDSNPTAASSWLSNEHSQVSHHQLEKAQITLRGGAEDDDIELSSPESFDKKKSNKEYCLSRFAKWYMKQMETNELRTKCISAGILGLIGDVCAQEVGHYLTASSSSSIQDSSNTLGILSRLDKRRMLAMFSDGALTTGPLLHFVYAWYESILPIPEIIESSYASSPEEKRAAVRKRFTVALIHVLFDNFIMAILYVFLMMIITAILEGKYESIPMEIRHDFLPAIKASWKASLMGLAPMQLMSFHFLPMELRVLAVNVQDVVWVTVMSYVTHRNRH